MRSDRINRIGRMQGMDRTRKFRIADFGFRIGLFSRQVAKNAKIMCLLLLFAVFADLREVQAPGGSF